jgi:hypothetical protein
MIARTAVEIATIAVRWIDGELCADYSGLAEMMALGKLAPRGTLGWVYLVGVCGFFLSFFFSSGILSYLPCHERIPDSYVVFFLLSSL